MAIRRLNRRPRAMPDWRSRFDRPYYERWYNQPGETFARHMPGRQPQHYRRLDGAYDEPALETEHRQRWGAWGEPGPFTGMGPRDYHPTDEKIHEQACERLMRHGQVDARHIQVEVSDGQIRLHGSVSGPAERRMAEDALWSIPGVKDVKNTLRVERKRPERGGASFRAQPPRGWKFKVEVFETKRSARPASGEDVWAADYSDLTLLESGLLPVTGREEPQADSPVWTIFTQEGEEEVSLDEREAGFEPYERYAGPKADIAPSSSEKAISLTTGMEVVDRDGVALGRVKEVRPDDFLLDRPLARDLYVPYSAVQSTGEHAVLNVRAEEVGNQGWEQPDIM